MDNKEKEYLISNMINTLIKDEWDAVEGYNSAIATLSDYDDEDNILSVLEDIRDEEYIHIGQLESCLSVLAGNPTEQIDDGSEEGFEQLELPEEDAELELDEDFDEVEYPITDARDAEDNDYYEKLYVKQYGRV